MKTINLYTMEASVLREIIKVGIQQMNIIRKKDEHLEIANEVATNVLKQL